jgi:ATP-dependent Clp protease ATP-binding subunit ClpC
MFEHFTDHARRVLDLEGMEAQRMHHDYMGTEHLLIALIREPEGHGHRALENLGVDLKHARDAVHQIIEDGPDTELPDGGLHFSSRCKHVMELALIEARRQKSPNIGTEHLLLGLLQEKEGVALQALAKLNLTPTQVEQEVLRMLEEERACA